MSESPYNGLVLGFRADANFRIYKFSVLVQSSLNSSTQSQQYAALPGEANGVFSANSGANAPGVLGVLKDHFVEPNYFVQQATPPPNVTGTVPTLYNLQGRGLSLQVNGVARCLAAAAINQGQLLVIADGYGRVMPASGLAPGTIVYPVGMALHNTTNINDIVQVELNFAQSKV